MKTKNNIKKIFHAELQEVYKAIEFEEYRSIENIIDKVNDADFTRFCFTLLVDELISFETEQFNQEIDDEDDDEL